MLRIDIQNTGTGTKEVADYTYKVMSTVINDDGEIRLSIIAQGEVKNFKRKLGWRVLTEQVLEVSKLDEIRRITKLLEQVNANN